MGPGLAVSCLQLWQLPVPTSGTSHSSWVGSGSIFSFLVKEIIATEPRQTLCSSWCCLGPWLHIHVLSPGHYCHPAVVTSLWNWWDGLNGKPLHWCWFEQPGVTLLPHSVSFQLKSRN